VHVFKARTVNFFLTENNETFDFPVNFSHEVFQLRKVGLELVENFHIGTLVELVLEQFFSDAFDLVLDLSLTLQFLIEFCFVPLLVDVLLESYDVEHFLLEKPQPIL